MAITTTKYQAADVRKSVRLLLYGNHLNRDSTTNKDQRYVNFIPETSKNLVNDLKKFFLVKRPGTTLYSTVVGSSAEGRGVYYWNGNTYSIFGNKLYKNTTAIQTLITSTGACGFMNMQGQDGELLFVCDGTKAYTVDSVGNVLDAERSIYNWAADEILEIGDTRIPTSSPTYYYTVTAVTGQKTTGSTEPTWPTTVGNTVVDNEITWTCTAAYTGANEWAGTHAYVVGDVVKPTDETGAAGPVWARCVKAGTSAGTEPDWTTLATGDITDSGAVWTFGGYYGGFPSPHIPQPVVLNGKLMLAEQGSVDAYNCEINNPYSWRSDSFVSAESFSDPIIALARQNNYIVAFGENNTELFYDAVNETGSPFSRRDDFLLQTGILTPYAITQAERFVTWVGRSDAGKSAVWVMDGFQPREVSTEYIEKILSSETNVSGIFGYGFRIIGHFFFLINLPTANKTLIYDLEESVWHEWSYNGAEMPFNFYTDAAGTAVLQHISNGSLYKLDPTAYSDFDSSTISCLAVTQKHDFDTNKRKFIHRVDVVGDQANTNVTFSWSDDDYQTWSAGASLSLSERGYFMRNGSTRRRAFKVLHEAPSPLRLEALEVVYTQGNT